MLNEALIEEIGHLVHPARFVREALQWGLAPGGSGYTLVSRVAFAASNSTTRGHH